MPSSSAARCQGLWAGAAARRRARCRRGTARARRRSPPPRSSDAPGESSSIRGRGGLRLPFVPAIAANLTCAAMAEVAGLRRARRSSRPSARRGDRAHPDAFERHARGDWVMPAKVYVDAPPARRLPRDARARRRARDAQVGDLVSRATPRAGCRWSPGALLVSSAETGELLAIMDCAAITSLRTGAAAAVSAQALAARRRRDGRADRLRRQRRLGGALPRRRRLRARASASTRAPRRPRRSPASSAGAPGAREEAAAQDVVVTVTPAATPVIDGRRPAPGPAPRGARRRRRTARPRSSSTALDALLASSATSGSRRRRAASSPGRSPPGRSTARG